MIKACIALIMVFGFPLSMSRELRPAHHSPVALDSHFTVHALYLGKLKMTGYRSVPEQTDSSPEWTSIGVRVNPHMVAVSQDLLKSKAVSYGDTVYIPGIGFKFVSDCMNQRHRKAIDVWLETREQERQFDKKWRGKKVQVWVIKSVTAAAN